MSWVSGTWLSSLVSPAPFDADRRQPLRIDIVNQRRFAPSSEKRIAGYIGFLPSDDRPTGIQASAIQLFFNA